jgi:16S rRNA (guanine(966)-N(2))-methyltransferase RsmD
MRVIAGKYRSRPLRSLRGMDIRPTADRLRESLFNVLTAGQPEALAGSTWLDLFAGTGAVGIEALSRGAGEVTFVESSAPAARVVRQNLEALGIETGFTVLQGDVLKALKKIEAATKVDFVFLDPPYDYSEGYRGTLDFLAGAAFVGAKTIVIAEHTKRFDPGEKFGTLMRFRKLVQGDAGLSFYRRGVENAGQPEGGATASGG